MAASVSSSLAPFTSITTPSDPAVCYIEKVITGGQNGPLSRGNLYFFLRSYENALQDYESVLKQGKGSSWEECSEYLSALCGRIFTKDCLGREEEAEADFWFLIQYLTQLNTNLSDYISWLANSQIYSTYSDKKAKVQKAACLPCAEKQAEIMLASGSGLACHDQCDAYAVGAYSLKENGLKQEISSISALEPFLVLYQVASPSVSLHFSHNLEETRN